MGGPGEQAGVLDHAGAEGKHGVEGHLLVPEPDRIRQAQAVERGGRDRLAGEEGEDAAEFGFTSSLPVQVLKFLAPSITTLMQEPASGATALLPRRS